MYVVIWRSQTLVFMRACTKEIRQQAGYLIYQLQQGENLSMPHSRRVVDLGPGCFELRIKGKNGIFRIFYCVKITNKILIFHAFQKKTQKIPNIEIEIGKRNLRELLNEK